ncbi:HAD-IC family P-type ATPase, partial [Mucilaginibacter sp.]|uniref:HAD-IC family P-type ATPase n=1 Tax=Mucilaginibacter sp. TaxID=1882438 RepID=UPI00374CD174
MTLIETTRKLKIPGNGAVSGFDEAAVILLRQVSKEDHISFYTTMESSEQGLNKTEVINKKGKFGLNEIQHEKAPAWYVQLFQAFLNPFIAVLIILAGVSFVMDVLMAAPGEGDYKTVIVVSVMVMLSSLLRFWQEYTSNRAAEELKSMVKTTSTVLRQGKGKFEINIIDLVPGDIVFLSAGDMIPADCRIIQSKDLFISQAMLTGESLPVEKRELAIPDADKKSPLELENICFMGTNVVSGT